MRIECEKSGWGPSQATKTWGASSPDVYLRTNLVEAKASPLLRRIPGAVRSQERDCRAVQSEVYKYTVYWPLFCVAHALSSLSNYLSYETFIQTTPESYNVLHSLYPRLFNCYDCAFSP
jgi:hypothetical protein